jgi:P-type Ca2+ transporter type 2C
VIFISVMESESVSGLSEEKAAQRLQEEGYNELPGARRRGFLKIAGEVVREPMLLLLLGAAVIYFVLGDLKEGLLLVGSVGVVLGITLYQEIKAERSLEALRNLSSPRAMVLRGGERKRIPGRDVVRGDVVFLSEGDRVPADAWVLSCTHLYIDEALLTGESLPVRKIAASQPPEKVRPGGEDLAFVYSGTLVVQGSGTAKVLATGSSTEMGRIGKALQILPLERTYLQKEVGRLVRIFGSAALLLCTFLVVFYGLSRGSFLEGSLVGITMAMSMIPEEFPVVLTIFLALGAWRISKQGVLTRRIPAVETLGATTVLCVDKTGTLTQNRMVLSRLSAEGEVLDLSAGAPQDLSKAFRQVLEIGILASQHPPFDPMERALYEMETILKQDGTAAAAKRELLRQYPLSQDLLALTQVWKYSEQEDLLVAAKGAPEAIVQLCHLPDSKKQKVFEEVQSMAQSGLRILGVARARYGKGELPDQQQDFEFEWLGLLGFSDPIRPTVTAAIQECRQAGIRVIMITGDYPGTAQNIARQIGLHPVEEVITGSELEQLEDAELRRRIQSANIFARVLPEQKLRIVEVLKAHGEVVAMTGDGVNDAPALKAAHIGIAMGERGTDVAREAAALVLVDDDFSSIVAAVRMGRRIFDNLKKAMVFIAAIHIPIAGLALLPVLLKWPLIFFPVHIVFLELIIDPSCSIIFEMEPAEHGLMQRLPRDPREPLFGKRSGIWSIIQGLSAFLIALAFYGIILNYGAGEAEARAMAFSTLILIVLGIIFTDRSSSSGIWETLRLPNPAWWWISGGTLLLLALVLYTPFLYRTFGFSHLHLPDIAWCMGAGLIATLWFQLLKRLREKFTAGRGERLLLKH